MRNRMGILSERWQRRLDDLRFKLSWTEDILRQAEKQSRDEQVERARQKLDALRTEIREHRANRFFA